MRSRGRIVPVLGEPQTDTAPVSIAQVPSNGHSAIENGGAAGRRPGDTADMGLNPYRQQRRSAADYLMVIGAVAVTALLVAWAFLG
jgi:hypothetical protein